eukprot:5097914-Prymnesium_polylepis.1
MRAAFTIEELLNLKYDLRQLKGHCDAKEVFDLLCARPPADMGQPGAAAAVAKKMKDAGFTAIEMTQANVGIGVLAAAKYTPSTLKAAGITFKQMLSDKSFDFKDFVRAQDSNGRGL